MYVFIEARGQPWLLLLRVAVYCALFFIYIFGSVCRHVLYKCRGLWCPEEGVGSLELES